MSNNPCTNLYHAEIGQWVKTGNAQQGPLDTAPISSVSSEGSIYLENGDYFIPSLEPAGPWMEAHANGNSRAIWAYADGETVPEVQHETTVSKQEIIQEQVEVIVDEEQETQDKIKAAGITHRIAEDIPGGYLAEWTDSGGKAHITHYSMHRNINELMDEVYVSISDWANGMFFCGNNTSKISGTDAVNRWIAEWW